MTREDGGQLDRSGFQQCNFETHDRLILRGLSWSAAEGGEPKASILLMHGLGDYTGRHLAVARSLAAAGIAGVMFDFRGHGVSDGRRGDVRHPGDFLKDMERMLEHMPPAGRTGLLAFSFGAQIAAGHLLNHPDDARIGFAAFVAPWFRLRIRAPRWQLALAAVALRFVPWLRQRTPLKPEQLASDQDFLRAAAIENRTHNLISARLYAMAVESGERAIFEAAKIRVPILIAHGMNDPVTCPEASREFYDRTRSRVKTFWLLDEVRHEPHNDVGRDEFLKGLAEWIARESPASSYSVR